MKEREGTEVEIPRELMQAIVRTQARKDLDFWDACLELALKAEPGNEAFNKAVKAEADRQAKSRYFDQLNRIRNNISQEGYARGVEYTRTKESNFSIPCGDQTCPEPMDFSSRYSNWPEVKGVLRKAFAHYTHGGHASKSNQPTA